MKLIRLSFIIAVAVMAIVGIGTTSYAFHDGGVASCESCHTMHNSLQGVAMGVNGRTTNVAFLLKGSDQSSTCLNCHENTSAGSYHISTPTANFVNASPINYTPGGDFAWLKTAGTGTAVNRHGHNIVAADFGYNADSENTTAPGGSFIAANLSCISCHNPHNALRRIDESGAITKPSAGNNVYGITAHGSYSNDPIASATAPVGVYRFLRGAGADQAPKSYPTIIFNANPPDAVTTNDYNHSEATNDIHTAYGAGMSAWCGNCHGAFYDTAGDSAVGNSAHPHPTNKAIGAAMSAIYNTYKGSGDLSNPTTGGYSSLVPVEMGTSDYTALRAAASSTGGGTYLATDANAKVMCLSCHRAHASGFPSMTRFNVGGNTTDATGGYVMASGQTTTLQATAAYYNQPATRYDANTRQLCNKCHAKD